MYLSDLLSDEHLPRLMGYYHPYLGDEFLKKHFAASAQHAVHIYASEELNKVHVFELQSPEQIDEILAKVISLKSATKFLAVNETISVYGSGEVVIIGAFYPPKANANQLSLF